MCSNADNEKIYLYLRKKEKSGSTLSFCKSTDIQLRSHIINSHFLLLQRLELYVTHTVDKDQML